jgi:putative transcriptional regulator
MAIVVNLDVMMARGAKMKSNELAERSGQSAPRTSRAQDRPARAIRFTTLEALCRTWTASPGTSWSIAPGSESRPAAVLPDLEFPLGKRHAIPCDGSSTFARLDSQDYARFGGKA